MTVRANRGKVFDESAVIKKCWWVKTGSSYRSLLFKHCVCVCIPVELWTFPALCSHMNLSLWEY